MRPSRTTGALGLAVVLACVGAAASRSPEPQARHHRLDIRELMFDPRDLEAAPGDTLSWVNHDIVPHTVTEADGAWDSGEVAPGAEFTLVAEGVATIHYVCRYHATMTGRLVVH